jgi:ADP-ribose pyrophosphatase YjhB (NUDIX family)
VAEHGLAVKTAVRLAVVHRDSVLTLRYEQPARHFNLPGGKVLPDETLAGTALRKLAAVCPLDVVVDRLLFVHETLPAGRGSDPAIGHKLEFVLLGLAREEHTELPSGPVGDAVLAWVPRAELAAIPLLPPIGALLFEASRPEALRRGVVGSGAITALVTEEPGSDRNQAPWRSSHPRPGPAVSPRTA